MLPAEDAAEKDGLFSMSQRLLPEDTISRCPTFALGQLNLHRVCMACMLTSTYLCFQQMTSNARCKGLPNCMFVSTFCTVRTVQIASTRSMCWLLCGVWNTKALAEEVSCFTETKVFCKFISTGLATKLVHKQCNRAWRQQTDCHS